MYLYFDELLAQFYLSQSLEKNQRPIGHYLLYHTAYVRRLERFRLCTRVVRIALDKLIMNSSHKQQKPTSTLSQYK